MSRFLLKKLRVPRRVLSFLGIEIDSVNMVFHLPADKLEKLLGLVGAVPKVTLRASCPWAGFFLAGFLWPRVESPALGIIHG